MSLSNMKIAAAQLRSHVRSLLRGGATLHEIIDTVMETASETNDHWQRLGDAASRVVESCGADIRDHQIQDASRTRPKEGGVVTALYHFTKIRNVPSIMRHGLRPHSSCRLVAYAPVVWLTEQQTRRDFAPGWRRDCLKRGWRGSPTWLHDRSLRLVIFKPNVPLLPWIEWVTGQPFYGAIEMRFARRYMSKWWIAFAPIAPDCISVGAAR